MDTLWKQHLLDELCSLLTKRAPTRETLDPVSSSGDFGDQAQRVVEIQTEGSMVQQRNDLLREINILRGYTPPVAVIQIDVGTVVQLRYCDSKVTKNIFILPVGGGERLASGVFVMTLNSPLGKALAGRKQGEILEFKAPSGPQKVEILSVE